MPLISIIVIDKYLFYNSFSVLEMRIMNGNASASRSSQSQVGRLEVRLSPVMPWGSVCDDMFQGYSASAACRYMGFKVGEVGNANSHCRLSQNGNSTVIDISSTMDLIDIFVFGITLGKKHEEHCKTFLGRHPVFWMLIFISVY